jgi:hypothetical protein
LRGTAPSARRLAEATIGVLRHEPHDGHMQKNTKNRKLALKTTTLRDLTGEALLTSAVGGVPPATKANQSCLSACRECGGI